MERSLPPLVLAIPTCYLRPEFLNTSETTEFVLDFSTVRMTGVWNNPRISTNPNWRFGLLSEKGFLSL
jgi:hypothetical protein